MTAETGKGGDEWDVCREILDAFPGLVCAVDRQGSILFLNRALAGVLGLPSHGMAGRPASEVLAPLPVEVRELLYTALAEGAHSRRPIEWERPGAPALVLESMFLPLCGPVPGGEAAAPGEPSSVGPVTGAVWTARIREPGERESAARAAESSRRKTKEILSIIRHDIFNQLTILIGFLQYSEDVIADPQVREFIGREEAAGVRIQELVEFTREFQDLAVEEPRWIPVASLVAAAVNRTERGSVRVEASVGRTEIFASPLVEKAFATLVQNAIVHGRTLTRIAFRTRQDEGDLVITCEDDGIGIPDEERPALFERGHGRNAGYGLWLAREILSITGATITEASAKEKGARFEIRVPAGMWRRM